MSRSGLRERRARIERLAADSGRYGLRCARRGDRPVPAAGLRFDTRAEGRRAARAVERYRAALRRYDPTLPVYDVVVWEEAPLEAVVTATTGDADGTRATGGPERAGADGDCG